MPTKAARLRTPEATALKGIRGEYTSESKDWEAVEAGNVEQYPIPEGDHVLPSSAIPEVKGWFGFGKDQAGEKTFESVTEPQEESSFRNRKITVEDENDPEGL